MSERRFTTVDDHRIHSVHAGAGEPVVLLHGLCGSHRWWRHTVPALAARYRVHVPELVGFGRSRGSGPQPEIRELTDLLRSWIERQVESPFRLIGHSMGGQIALHLAADGAALEALALVAPAGIPRERTLGAAARLLCQVVPPRRWGAPSFLPTVAGDVLRTGPRTLLAAARSLLEDDVRPLLGAIAARTLLIWGELDPLVPVAHGREMATAMANAELVVVEGAAHNVMADRPAEFNGLLLAFLAGRERPRPGFPL